MLLFLSIDTTEEAPVRSAEQFRNETELRVELVVDRQQLSDEELGTLLDEGVYREDKRAVFQLIRFNDGEEQGETIECKSCECPLNYCCCHEACSRCNEAPTHCTCDPIEEGEPS